MGSVGSNSSLVLGEMQSGQDYEARKNLLNTTVADIVDKEGAVLVGNESEGVYYSVTPNIQAQEGKYQVTEFNDGEPKSHEVGNDIADILEKYFASHLPIRRI